ncbi:RsmF rRNA methyltransferase first C-terminal domain-containing protein [Alicyclobacillus kakegawensis]|uniref:RsmF rRNA methyltransferase first C-terminal domain-containing protein n=1 Tax=Alicyclobacillus kakegawensis TaxID=392012 RepID=UPI0009FB2765|nr:RsmF rRNA methyltransferase first C-terminal domain-containing protein [Alicyclobacillus kakegawensis]
MDWLPTDFKRLMKPLLGREWQDFCAALEQPPMRAARAGDHAGQAAGLSPPRGAHPETIPRPAHAMPVPWRDDAFLLPPGSRLGSSPWVMSGACYIQEPSAMAVVPALDPRPGERVLDLCAAPGGKATDIARRLRGQGVLVANEPHPARVRTLVENLERAGAPALVTQALPHQLAAAVGVRFDAILVDAPCSGEGMFRKDPEARRQWQASSPASCARRQREILACALSMLRPGGRLVYSTCTFNPFENEHIVAWALDSFPVVLEDIPLWPGWEPGRPEWLGDPELTRRFGADITRTRRLWPHKGAGEGHFVARFRRLEEHFAGGRDKPARRSERQAAGRRRSPSANPAEWRRAVAEWVNPEQVPLPWHEPLWRGPHAYAAPDPELLVRLEQARVRIHRPGLWLASQERGRLEPQHALAMAVPPQLARQSALLDEELAVEYLSGAPLPDLGLRGRTLVHLSGWPLGWGNGVSGRTNNLYPKGLRRTDLRPLCGEKT